MRLEVREDNAPAIALYQRLGYRQFGTYRDYYEDHGNALRFERRILFYEPRREFLPVPYYPQTTEFTCGPAALIMAMAALNEQQPLTTLEELQIWREATTIFMLAGHGGCGPQGLAHAAWRRGYEASLWVSHEGPLFLETVRSGTRSGSCHWFIRASFRTSGRRASAFLRTLVPAGYGGCRSGTDSVILIGTWQLNRGRTLGDRVRDGSAFCLPARSGHRRRRRSRRRQTVPAIDRQIFEKMSRYGKTSLCSHGDCRPRRS